MRDGRGAYYLAIIPARGGSKRVPRKNLRQLSGKPLISYTVEAALTSRRLSRVVVSTDDSEIAGYCKALGAEVPFMRPAEIANDTSPIIETLEHAVLYVEREGITVDAVVLLQPTSPMRTHRHIDEAVGVFEGAAADTLTAVCPASEHPYYCWSIDGDTLMPNLTMNHIEKGRHELPPVFVENGSIYIMRRPIIGSGSIYGERIVPYLMRRDESVDIDTPEDFLYAEFLSSSKKGGL